VGPSNVVVRTADGHTIGLAARADGTQCILYDDGGASVCPPSGESLDSQPGLVLSGMVKVDPATGAATPLNLFGLAPANATAVEVVAADGSTQRATMLGRLFYAPATPGRRIMSVRAVNSAGQSIARTEISR
jgi:hypothetical protein